MRVNRAKDDFLQAFSFLSYNIYETFLYSSRSFGSMGEQTAMKNLKIYILKPYHLIFNHSGLHHQVIKSLVAAYILLFLIGCKSQSTFTETTGDPTSTSLPTETNIQVFVPLEIPTVNLTKEANPGPTASIETISYTHPQGLFSIQAPKGWLVTQGDKDITFTAPEDDLVINITALNTGYALDSESFNRFISIQEDKKALEVDSYIEIDRRSGSHKDTYTVINSFYDREILRKGATYYQNSANAVIIANFYSEEVIFDTYSGLFDILSSSIELNEKAVTALPVYSYNDAKLHSNHHFSIRVPPYWQFNRTEEDHMMIDTFISPDENAVIQTIVFDDGQKVSKVVASELALTLLRENYTKDISVTKDEVIKDGREKLSWRSNAGDYQGITSFAVRGTEIYVVTVMWSNDPAQLYQNILEDVQSSYWLDGVSE